MITASSVYETLLDIARKDLRGRSLSVEEYNRVAILVNQNLFAKYYSDFESNPDSSETMSSFKVLNEAIPLVAGVGTLPTYYYAMVGMPWYTDTGGTRRYLDFVSSMEHAKREQDYLTKASLTYPTCRLGIADVASNKQIYVTPTTITPIYLDYIKTPYTPALDYYINDTTLNYTWIDEADIVDIPLGSTAMDGTIGFSAGYASSTLNWELDEEDFPLIINLFLQYLRNSTSRPNFI